MDHHHYHHYIIIMYVTNAGNIFHGRTILSPHTDNKDGYIQLKQAMIHACRSIKIDTECDWSVWFNQPHIVLNFLIQLKIRAKLMQL